MSPERRGTGGGGAGVVGVGGGDGDGVVEGKKEGAEKEKESPISVEFLLSVIFFVHTYYYGMTPWMRPPGNLFRLLPIVVYGLLLRLGCYDPTAYFPRPWTPQYSLA